MIISLQYARAVAALMIVIFHLRPRIETMGWGGHWPTWLAAGVDLFFVLSGFLMWATTDGRDADGRTFFWRRVTRIVPVYWLLTLVVLSISIVAPSLMKGETSVAHALGSFFFVPIHNGDPTDYIQPLIPQGWTLNYEMAFYLLFALALFLPTTPRLVVTLSVLCAVALAEIFDLDPHSILGFYTDSIVAEFGLGVTLGYMSTRRYPSSQAGGYALIALGFAGFAALTATFPYAPRFFKWGIPAAAIVAGCIMIKHTAKLRLPALLGDASYSIYLTHGIALSAAAVIWKKLSLHKMPLGVEAFMIAGAVGATIAGVICYWYIEKPIEDRLRARRSSRKALDAAEAAA